MKTQTHPTKPSFLITESFSQFSTKLDESSAGTTLKKPAEHSYHSSRLKSQDDRDFLISSILFNSSCKTASFGLVGAYDLTITSFYHQGNRIQCLAGSCILLYSLEQRISGILEYTQSENPPPCPKNIIFVRKLKGGAEDEIHV